jgi:hypothetical protein
MHDDRVIPIAVFHHTYLKLNLSVAASRYAASICILTIFLGVLQDSMRAVLRCMAFSAAEIRACNSLAFSFRNLKLCLPAPDILSRRQVRRAQPEKLIVKREHLGVFGDCVREQHPATVAAVLSAC